MLAIAAVAVLALIAPVAVSGYCSEIQCGVQGKRLVALEEAYVPPVKLVYECIPNLACEGPPAGFTAKVCTVDVTRPKLRCTGRDKVLVLRTGDPNATATVHIIAFCPAKKQRRERKKTKPFEI